MPSYICNCSRHCKAPKSVSKTTYNNHARYRALDACTPRFRAFLSEGNVSTSAEQPKHRRKKRPCFRSPEPAELPAEHPHSQSPGPAEPPGPSLGSDGSTENPRLQSPEPAEVLEPPGLPSGVDSGPPDPGSLHDEEGMCLMNNLACMSESRQ